MLGAEERIARLEYELFDEVRGRVAGARRRAAAPRRARWPRSTSLAGLAEVAHVRGHVRPVVDDSDALEIVDGRHPVLEAGAGAPFTPNDLEPRPERARS